MEATVPAPVGVARPESGFLQRVFMWMFVGLAVTGGIAAAIGSNDELLTTITETPGLVIGVVIAQLALVFILAFAIIRISATTATALFLLYSALVGVTFAFIFELYTAQSIFTTFLIAAAMFGSLAFFGATTDMDLSKVGAIAFAALIGLIIATVINLFWANSTLYWITTYAGVTIFGALSLYLDFINLFLFLLRISGKGASRPPPPTRAPLCCKWTFRYPGRVAIRALLRKDERTASAL